MMTKAKRINILLGNTRDGVSKKSDSSSLNATERRFFLKHPDQVREVLQGERSHIRANKIVMKMLMLDLTLDDFDDVYETLRQGKA